MPTMARLNDVATVAIARKTRSPFVRLVAGRNGTSASTSSAVMAVMPATALRRR